MSLTKADKIAIEGDKLFNQNKFAEAADRYRTALRNRPQHPIWGLNLAAALLRMGKWEEAREQYRKGLPHANAELNLALLAMYDGEFEEAEKRFDTVLAKEPTNAAHHHDRACLDLIRGRWREGWERYEWRWLGENASWRPDPQHEWRGGPIPDILMLPEQGFGDNLMMGRYIRHVPANRRALIIREEWKPLFQRMDGVTETPDEGRACVFTSMMSLPLRTGILEPIWEGTYLQSVGEPPQLPDGFNVGVVWKGNPKHKHDNWRSATAEDFAPLSCVEGVNLISLQVPDEETTYSLTRLPITSYEDTLRIISALDLVVTIDSSVLHAAGAMGKEVWALISRVPDWRWGLKTETTPWYPSVKLYRQKTLCDWSEVIGRVANDLRIRIAQWPTIANEPPAPQLVTWAPPPSSLETISLVT